MGYQRHRRDAVTSRLRLRGYDYSSPSNYFITMCTQNRACLFGEVQDGILSMSTAGLVIESWWFSISRKFPEVQVDSVVVMPNHLHGILMFGTMADDPDTLTVTPLKRVMQWFKGNSTNDYMLGVGTDGWPRFDRRLWQKGYFEHIVRSDRELDRLRDYIAANPSQWHEDEYFWRKAGR